MKQIQMSFDQPELIKPEPEASAGSIQEAFERFHELNPSVYRNLLSMAHEMKRRGRKQIGMKMLFELLRWNYYLNTDDPNSKFRLCNNYTSRYSRLISEQEPDLEDVFSFRKLISE
tara:strand:- start:147 stop:494 length:348 start_codon:yes stop_codon:yes gene_type:complete